MSEPQIARGDEYVVFYVGGPYDGQTDRRISLDGRWDDELTVSVLGRQALPSIRIVPKGAFYDYHAKYVAEDTQYLCPGLDGAAEDEIRALALAAFDALACSSWGRVDIMRDREGRNWLLEANTAPGMTSHSLVPKAASAVGIDFQTLCWRILESTFEREPGGAP